jgi:putative tryptophan/tyrosine transport system substrate-binding protein
MNRRAFITLLGGATAVWPLAARAQLPQQRSIPSIGLLSGLSPGRTIESFLAGLRESGFIEVQNVTIEYRFASGQYDLLPALAAELIMKKVAVIATLGENAAKAAQAASGGIIPVVFSLGDDPVSLGLVASLNRPGANITGSISVGHTLGPKRVELLREFLPNGNTLALLTNPKQPREFERRDVENKLRTVGWQLRYLSASSTEEFEQVFNSLVSDRIDGLIIANETFFFSEIGRLASLASNYRVPAIGPLRAFADAGGLMSYGAHIPDVTRYAGIYTGRVLKGTKPADLPVMQPSRFELVINAKAAKALNLAIPVTLQVAAGEVIE